METFWAAFFGGGLAGIILNTVEIIILINVGANINRLLKQLKEFKLEGEDERWLK